MSITQSPSGSHVTNIGAGSIQSKSFTAPALGAVAAVMAAYTDDSKYHRLYNGNIWAAPGGAAVKLTATVSGVASDVKAIAVTIIGTDAADAPLTETLPVFTLDTITTVTSLGSFKTVNSISIPAHDGTDVNTSVGYVGGAVDAVIAAWPDKGIVSLHKTVTTTNPAVTRNITATTAGTNTDVKAISVIVYGLNDDGVLINETLPAFTVDTNGTVVGNKAFKTVKYVDLPAHDGNGATTSIGTGAKLGLGSRMGRNKVLAAYLNGVKEATDPTVAFSSTVTESNTAQLSSALNGSDVIVDFY